MDVLKEDRFIQYSLFLTFILTKILTVISHHSSWSAQKTVWDGCVILSRRLVSPNTKVNKGISLWSVIYKYVNILTISNFYQFTIYGVKILCVFEPLCGMQITTKRLIFFQEIQKHIKKIKIIASSVAEFE